MSERPISGSYRPTIMGTHAMVASGHYLATQAGARILARGGNAIDAGVAAGLCLTVLHIDMVNLAGVAPIIVYLAEEDRVVTISGLGRWPQAASIAYFKEHCGGKIPPGVLRCITPGSPDAWITALERYGTLSLEVVMEEALRLAAEGFPMHPFMASNLRDAVGQFTRWPSSAAVLMPGGRLPEPGEIFAQPDLARTMRRLLDAEAGARPSGRQAGLRAARDLFYRGDIAREIAAFYAAEGGLLTYDDLAAFNVQVEEPVRARFHEYEVFTCGPWCQGPVLAQVLTCSSPMTSPRSATTRRPMSICSPRPSSSSSPTASVTTAIRSSSTCQCAPCSRNPMPTRGGSSSILPARTPGCRRPAIRGTSTPRRRP